jgi:hypothetical protein
MQHVEGGSIAQRMATGGVNVAQALEWLRGVGEALDFAHRREVLHRDVKPANVLLSSDGRALLADFGIAKAGESSTRLTATGMVLGTPAYMAPELIVGGGAKPASDRYALAVMAYELLCGMPPFRGESAFAVLHQHAHVEAPRPTSWAGHLPSGVDPVFERALSKEPERRQASGREFTEELAVALRGVGGPRGTRPTGRPQRAAAGEGTQRTAATGGSERTVAAVLVSEGPTWRVKSRSRLPLALAVLAALVVGLGGVALAWRLRPAAPVGAPPPASATAAVPGPEASRIAKPAEEPPAETQAASGRVSTREDTGGAVARDRPSTPSARTVGVPAGIPLVAQSKEPVQTPSTPAGAGREASGVSAPPTVGGAIPPATAAPAPTPSPVVPPRILTREDFQRLLAEARRNPDSPVASAVAEYAVGGLAYLNGDLATARSTLEKLRAGAPIEALGPWFRQTLKGEVRDWSLPLAYAQPALALEALRAAIDRGDDEAAQAAVPVSRALLASGQRLAAKDLLARACAAGNELACERPAPRPQRRLPLRRRPGGG